MYIGYVYDCGHMHGMNVEILGHIERMSSLLLSGVLGCGLRWLRLHDKQELLPDETPHWPQDSLVYIYEVVIIFLTCQCVEPQTIHNF